jgi:hypothetical protein
MLKTKAEFVFIDDRADLLTAVYDALHDLRDICVPEGTRFFVLARTQTETYAQCMAGRQRTPRQPVPTTYKTQKGGLLNQQAVAHAHCAMI